ncbi:MAG: (2Fe-2S)-binding protein [Candidatus Neomarinimicrobiota bacterium]
MPELSLTVNGVLRTVLVEPHETLLTVLRERLQFTGTKLGCDEGSCGACTVLLEGKPVLSCLTPALRCGGKDVLTIEGVADGPDLHPVQNRLVESGGIQCGFCTPGVVMTSLAYLDKNIDPDETDIREALAGNLCRCTGYAKIVKGVQAAAADLRNQP